MNCENNVGNLDCGPRPIALNICALTLSNTNFRTTLWTGEHLQITAMCIPKCGEIGIEMHSDLDQLLKIESGCGTLMMGECKDELNYKQNVNSNCLICVPAGTWHNLVNTGAVPIKLFSVYAPKAHPFGTVHKTKSESDEAHH